MSEEQLGTNAPQGDLSLSVLNNPIAPLLLLQFAVEHNGDDAEAKLARQVPRYLGRKFNLSNRFEARFLPFREVRDGKTFFVGTTDLPEREAVKELAAYHRIPYALYGKIGIGQHIRIEASLYNAQTDRILFRKGFETYPAYVADALDEICAETAKALGMELAREERMILFRRDTLLWEALLYYLIAEDERYAVETGVGTDIGSAVSAYNEALKLDPSFHLADSAATETVLAALSADTISEETAIRLLQPLPECSPSTTSSRRALMSLAALNDDRTAFRNYADELLELLPDDASLIAEIGELGSMF